MSHTPNYQHCDYLESLIRTEELRKVILSMANALRQYEFDAVAFTGVSGMLIGPGIAMALDKTMIVVRKEDGNCDSEGNMIRHSRLDVEGDLGARRYVVVDECIATGDTYNRIVQKIKETGCKAECIGAITEWDVRWGRTGLIAPGMRQPEPNL